MLADWIEAVPQAFLLLSWLLCLVTFAGDMKWGMTDEMDLGTDQGTVWFNTYVDGFAMCVENPANTNTLPKRCQFGSGEEFKKACLTFNSEADCAYFDSDAARKATYAFIIIAFIVLSIRITLSTWIQGRFCPGPRKWSLGVILDVIVCLCMIVALGVYQSSILAGTFMFQPTITFSVHADLGFVLGCVSCTFIVLSLAVNGYIKFKDTTKGGNINSQARSAQHKALEKEEEEEDIPPEWQ